MQAIGERLLVEAERDSRIEREEALRTRICERDAELRRLNTELDSLLKLAAEQRDVLERASNNEPADM